jgi:hypothetical protein
MKSFLFISDESSFKENLFNLNPKKMKTQKRFSILNYMVVLFAFGLLLSCEQLAPVEEPVQAAEEFMDMSSVALEPEDDSMNARLVYSSDCESDCIEPGSGNYFAIKDSKSQSSGINTKEVSYEAYNTEDNFVVNVKYEITSGPSKATASILVQINGMEKEFNDVPSGYTATYSVPLAEGWAKCDLVSFSIVQNGLGSPILFSEDYGLIPFCEDENDLILWNKLGSLFEVENSEVGPNGVPIGKIDFGAAKFDNGVIPKQGDASSGVNFPNNIFNPESGTVEFWFNPYFFPEPYSYGIYAFVLNRNEGDLPLVMNVYWWGEYTSLNFDMFFDYADALPIEDQSRISYNSFSPNLNEPVHVAFVWDRNGIEGSDQTQRIYVNGELVSFGTTSNWGTNNDGITRMATGIDSDYGESRYAMDNIKVYNYAKTDFSDRVNEGN